MTPWAWAQVVILSAEAGVLLATVLLASKVGAEVRRMRDVRQRWERAMQAWVDAHPPSRGPDLAPMLFGGPK